MKSLAEHNRQRAAAYRAAKTWPQFNGIACPQCGEELSDSDPQILPSNPPQRYILCQRCGFTGTRFV